jgi:DNA-binding protein YbaB
MSDSENRRAELARVQRDQGELRRQLAEIRGSGRDDDRLVEVEVAVGGRVTALTLHPRAMRHDSASLAELILATLDAATADATRQVQEIVGSGTTGPSWSEVLTRAEPPDATRPLPRLPDPASFDDMIRRARS